MNHILNGYCRISIMSLMILNPIKKSNSCECMFTIIRQLTRQTVL